MRGSIRELRQGRIGGSEDFVKSLLLKVELYGNRRAYGSRTCGM